MFFLFLAVAVSSASAGRSVRLRYRSGREAVSTTQGDVPCKGGKLEGGSSRADTSTRDWTGSIGGKFLNPAGAPIINGGRIGP